MIVAIQYSLLCAFCPWQDSTGNTNAPFHPTREDQTTATKSSYPMGRPIGPPNQRRDTYENAC